MTMSIHSVRDSFLQHDSQFRILFRDLAERTAVHAYLISGEKGTGKKTLAQIMGKILLCSSAAEKPCGVCGTCRDRIRAFKENGLTDPVEYESI